MKDATAKVPPNDQTIVGTIDRLISPGGLTVLVFLFLWFSQFSSQRGMIWLELSTGLRSYRSSALSGAFHPFQIIPSNHAKNILLMKVALTSGDIIPLSSRSQIQVGWFYIVESYRITKITFNIHCKLVVLSQTFYSHDVQQMSLTHHCKKNKSFRQMMRQLTKWYVRAYLIIHWKADVLTFAMMLSRTEFVIVS